jgi:PiT family inorganic phosphate transporter
MRARLMIAASLLVFIAVLLVAYANGANDIYKGVATLYGGGAASYRVSLLWAVGATLAGSLLAAVLAKGLIATFSGAGLVPQAVLADPSFVIAVSLGAAITVFASAIAGIPISTTHALTGALVGAGLVAARADLDFDTLGGKFLLPLAVSPLLSMVLVAVLYPLLSGLTRRAGITETSCICVSAVQTGVIASAGGAASILEAHQQIALIGRRSKVVRSRPRVRSHLET